MDTDQVGWRLKMEYRKGLFWDHFYLLFLLMTSIYEISKFADDIKIPS